jgi:hypothetical protein
MTCDPKIDRGKQYKTLPSLGAYSAQAFSCAAWDPPIHPDLVGDLIEGAQSTKKIPEKLASSCRISCENG